MLNLSLMLRIIRTLPERHWEKKDPDATAPGLSFQWVLSSRRRQGLETINFWLSLIAVREPIQILEQALSQVLGPGKRLDLQGQRTGKWPFP
jgi:hypothetical protein